MLLPVGNNTTNRKPETDVDSTALACAAQPNHHPLQPSIALGHSSWDLSPPASWWDVRLLAFISLASGYSLLFHAIAMQIKLALCQLFLPFKCLQNT